MTYFITLSGTNITGLYRDDVLTPPSGAIPVSNEFGETLRHCSNFGAYEYINGFLVPASIPAPVPQSITPWQIRKALNQLGLRSAVESAVASSSDQAVKDGWEFATEFVRSSPLVIGMGAALGKTGSELDALFTLGASL
ncbi:MAG: hypothetical protein WA049_06290 [Ferribacterium limneticum]